MASLVTAARGWGGVGSGGGTFVLVVAWVGKRPHHTFTRLNMVGALLRAGGIVVVGFSFGGPLAGSSDRRAAAIAKDEDVDAERRDSPRLGASV